MSFFVEAFQKKNVADVVLSYFLNGELLNENKFSYSNRTKLDTSTFFRKAKILFTIFLQNKNMKNQADPLNLGAEAYL